MPALFGSTIPSPPRHQAPEPTRTIKSTIRLSYQYVPHKEVAKVSKIANYKRLVAVNHGSQSKSTDGSKSGWRQRSVVVVVVAIVAMQLQLEW